MQRCLKVLRDNFSKATGRECMIADSRVKIVLSQGRRYKIWF